MGSILFTMLSRTSLQCVRYACTNSLNSVHHVTGNKMPEVDKNKVTLLNMRFCPYAQRTILCLNAKGVDYEIINCALMTWADWLWQLNPIGKVPVLMHKGPTLPAKPRIRCWWSSSTRCSCPRCISGLAGREG